MPARAALPCDQLVANPSKQLRRDWSYFGQGGIAPCSKLRSLGRRSSLKSAGTCTCWVSLFGVTVDLEISAPTCVLGRSLDLQDPGATLLD
mmetsp:Transcript_18144/g.41006  ORF Transcript_18144/g.41006 Transcript_18144/m.41006 type:complete len:91 (-) Transcript_18144:157-429(-)